jgi:hypothetical protein
MEVNNLNVYEKFSKLTNFDIVSYFDSFSAFISENLQDIVAFYSLTTTNPNMQSFTKMANLIKQSKKCLEFFNMYKREFNTYEFWELLDKVESVLQKLETVDNIGKYLRSSLGKDVFIVGITNELTLTRNTTLESKVASELGSANPDDDWVDVALSNDLTEEQYGKTPIILQYTSPNTNNNLLNVVLGKLEGEGMYGIDISKKVTFVADLNGIWDLKVLSPKETALQSIDTHLNLLRGDNPEFPNDGIQANLFIGNNISSLKLPILFRQLSNVFAKDDTFTSLAIVNANYSTGDTLNIFVEVQTVVGEVFKNKITK